MKCKLVAVIAGLVGFAHFNNALAETVTFYTTQAAFDADVKNTKLLDNFYCQGTECGGHPTAVDTTTLIRNGVTYTLSPFWSTAGDLVILPPGNSGGPNGIYGANVGVSPDYVLTSDYDEHIRATFSKTYKAVGFNAYFNGLANALPFANNRLTVFGEGGSVIGVLDFADGLDPGTGLADRGYLGFSTQQPIITGFEWDTYGGGYIDTGISNLSVFPPRETPLPPAALLFGTGLGALGLLGWRRKKKLAA